jgi:hypothetical protein
VIAARALLGRVPWQGWALLLLAGAFWWHGHERYQAGVAAERSGWEAVVAEANAKADQERQELEAAARRNNDEVRSRYETDLARIAADRDSLARRLRNAPVPAACPEPAESAGGSAAAGAGPEPRGESRTAAIDAALDVYDRSCQADAAQLNALIEQIRPQL